MIYGDPRLPAHFWAKVTPDGDGCWNWTGATNSRGYGQFGVNKVSTSTHRITYTTFVGPIPAELQIDHLCRNKRCCRPDHLEAVTGKVNIGRYAETITHCAQGHEFTPENTRRHSVRGTRICRTCSSAQRRAWGERQKQAAA